MEIRESRKHGRVLEALVYGKSANVKIGSNGKEKAAGVGLVIRKLMWMFTPEMEIVQDGEDFVITTKMPMITDRVEFKIGMEFTHKLPPDFKEDHTLLSTWEGDKLVTKILSQEDGVTTTRTLVGDKLVMTQSKGDVTATRTFYKMEKKD